jgi:hypothetical protein
MQRQPIQQFGMEWQIAGAAEILQGLNQPVPNSCSQARFTATRAVRAWSARRTSARVSRLRGAFAGSLGNSDGVSAPRSGPIW